MTTEDKLKVFVVPEADAKKYSVFQLKHPRTSTSTLCAIDDTLNKLHEIVHYGDDYSSWFAADFVIEDGSLFLLTDVDPLFFILSYVNKNGKFCPLEDLLVDENFPDIHNLQKCCTDTELTNIFDIKESSGFKVYCYNKTKTLHWLQKKVKYFSNYLMSKDIDITDGSTASVLKLNIENQDPKIILSYSCNLLSEYLSEDLFEELLKCLGLEKEENVENCKQDKSTSKKQNTSGEPIDDYSKKYPMNSAKVKQQSKLTVSQKKLQKVDKTGMKSISSFFQKK